MSLNYENVKTCLDDPLQSISDLSSKMTEDVLKVSSGSITTLAEKNDKIHENLEKYRTATLTSNLEKMEKLENELSVLSS